MKPKILITTVLLTVSCLLITYHCSAQNWQWANSAGGINIDGGGSICTDNNGNVYISGTIMEPQAYFSSDTLIVNGFTDFILAKYDADGNELWTKRFGGYNAASIFEYPNFIVYDSISNSIYMTGGFKNSCVFGSFTLTATSGDFNMFVAKFDLNGTCLWAKGAGNYGNNYSTGIVVEQNGNIFVSGVFQFGGTLDTISLGSGGFLAKYNSIGNCLWAKHIFDDASASFLKIYNGDVFTYGFGGLKDTITIDTIHIPAGTTFNGNVIARFDTLGNVKWAKLVGGPKVVSGTDFSLDAIGNCYITGGFTGGYAVFGNDTIFADTTDFFLAKYDQYGNFKWIQQGKSTISACAASVFSDAIGNTYLTGCFSGNTNFGNYNLTSSSAFDMFIARFDSSGNCFGIRNVANAGGGSVISDAYSNAYISGSFNDTTNFGSNTLISHGNSDIFVAKIDAFTGIGGGLKTTNKQLLIYANPNSGKCNINIPDEFVKEKNLTLTIFDISGKIIQQKTLALNDGKIKLDLQAEAKGIYNVSLTNGKKLYSGKIVFE